VFLYKKTEYMEKQGVWSESFRVQANMVNMRREMTLASIGNLFQEVAGNHAVYRKVGFFDMQQRGMYWVLNRLKINMLRYPLWQEDIYLRTWVSQMIPFSHRHFEVCDSQNQALGYGYALWIPIDATNHKPKRMTDFDIQIVDRQTPCDMPQKIADTEGYIFSSEKTVEYSDIDMLGHVNNVKYIEWILNDFYKKNDTKNVCKSLEINYLGEVYPNDTTLIFSKSDAQKTYYSLKKKDDGKEVCRAIVEQLETK
jgi:medium-chain acyl-[acyl-carrier-protein] hydrolase